MATDEACLNFCLGHVGILLYDDDDRPNVDLGENTNLTDTDFSFRTSGDDRISLQLSRKGSSPEKRKLVDASYGSVFVTKKYSEISLLLPSGIVYGLGGHPISFNQVLNCKINYSGSCLRQRQTDSPMTGC
jgi:hypothetical protein